jgi:hypothetical protein
MVWAKVYKGHPLSFSLLIKKFPILQKQQKLMSTSIPTSDNETATKQDTIFDDVYDLAPYEKSMKNARVWLYVIAAIQFILGIVEFNTVDDPTIAAVAFGIDAFIALVFLVLAVWSKKKPVIAFTIALSFYVVIIVSLALISGDFAGLAKGIIFKILIVAALIKANKDARKYEAIKQSLGQDL